MRSGNQIKEETGFFPEYKLWWCARTSSAKVTWIAWQNCLTSQTTRSISLLCYLPGLLKRKIPVSYIITPFKNISVYDPHHIIETLYLSTARHWYLPRKEKDNKKQKRIKKYIIGHSSQENSDAWIKLRPLTNEILRDSLFCMKVWSPIGQGRLRCRTLRLQSP